MTENKIDQDSGKVTVTLTGKVLHILLEMRKDREAKRGGVVSISSIVRESIMDLHRGEEAKKEAEQ